MPKDSLTLTHKFQVLYRILSDQKIDVLLEELKTEEVIQFLRDKSLEFGLKVKGAQFSDEELRKRLGQTGINAKHDVEILCQILKEYATDGME